MKVSAKKQIAIPVRMRKQIMLNEGEEVLLVSDGKRIAMEKITEDRFADLKHHAQKAVDKLWNNKED